MEKEKVIRLKDFLCLDVWIYLARRGRRVPTIIATTTIEIPQYSIEFDSIPPTMWRALVECSKKRCNSLTVIANPLVRLAYSLQQVAEIECMRRSKVMSLL